MLNWWSSLLMLVMAARKKMASTLLPVGPDFRSRGARKMLLGGHPWRLLVGCHQNGRKSAPLSLFIGFGYLRPAIDGDYRPHGRRAKLEALWLCCCWLPVPHPKWFRPRRWRAWCFSDAVTMEPDLMAFPLITLGSLLQNVWTCL